ncbi:Putative flippase GtrA (transmembrane translocase of bactoprenol-linked glucose) [Actinokineospora alba]|uniref:Putative flippase GtrA (Transmembrane translocase of bactoprenol-linked glucose) n=1 Tax=Actinokineospora alba TaxID=504798 RepID=A0A1H0U8K9_9PSEU|nr:GtrA family protein [Actinokineospora alba]TDP65265.1 putative flippase GtrA [Actinokineospora alba]SDH58350.1 Putative flippase GtrA (transmembrane translocase of bactoprenol-linked glucose) [Actinokineospora alba]SDP62504.1 Putative flippase GtrA (transmembrane translocase of bactoprenol-linked glucose) [Actinokineospora alba]
MTVVESVLARVPGPLRKVLIKHREMLKFAIVGGTTFVIDNAIWYVLKFTVLEDKPITAKAIAVIVATIVSYILNREWSFRTRGGRETHHEAALFFLISGGGVAINLIPPYISRYVLDLETPHVSLLVQEIADFASGSILGMLLAMFFRFWGFRKWVFPDELGARAGTRVYDEDEPDTEPEEALGHS